MALATHFSLDVWVLPMSEVPHVTEINWVYVGYLESRRHGRTSLQTSLHADRHHVLRVHGSNCVVKYTSGLYVCVTIR